MQSFLFSREGGKLTISQTSPSALPGCFYVGLQEVLELGMDPGLSP